MEGEVREKMNGVKGRSEGEVREGGREGGRSEGGKKDR